MIYRLGWKVTVARARSEGVVNDAVVIIVWKSEGDGTPWFSR
jgi:hypothetical protein